YQKILDEAIRELKRTEFKDLFKEEIQKQDDFVSDCSIDTDLEVLIPDEYVESITERLSLYSRLDNCETEKELEDLHKEMMDRFGPIPSEVEDLFLTVRCRKIAVELGFEKMMLKQEILKCFFVSNPESPYFTSQTFERILDFIQTKTTKAKLKQVGRNGILIVRDISTMTGLYRFLKQMEANLITEKEG
ncbi:MAG: TRCF domain-containing protein, partial [Ginsengibacter sp.]